MKWRNWLAEWGLESLKINFYFLELDWKPNDTDRRAAWDLYIELLTRITTQTLDPADGDEETALTSVFSLFGFTRETLRKHGAGCGEFAKLAIPVLNQIIRPFTANGTSFPKPQRSRTRSSAPLFATNLPSSKCACSATHKPSRRWRTWKTSPGWRKSSDPPAGRERNWFHAVSPPVITLVNGLSAARCPKRIVAAGWN